MLETIVKMACCRRWLAAFALSLGLILTGAVRAQVVVIANGSPITEFDIQQRTKLLATSGHKNPTRQEVIKELIDDRIKIARAKAYGFTIEDKEVNSAFQNMAERQHITPQQFTQLLERSGITAGAMKDRIRAELTWNQLVRGKFSSSLVVGEADIANALQSNNESSASTVAYLYTLYPITVVVPRGSNEAILKIKQQEAENLRGRFVECKQGLALARALRDVAVREPVSRSSADLPPPLRDLLGRMEVGHLTTPEVTAQGLQMFALCEKKESKTDSPAQREARNKIFSTRFETEAKRYLEELRKQAMIEYK